MSELYTSLTQLKMAMNGGELPPMTPLTEEAKRIVKPEFTIGMGALIEDKALGLMCPVCGKWSHNLSSHITQSHKSVGLKAVREALKLGKKPALYSAATMRNKRASARRGWEISEPLMRAKRVSPTKEQYAIAGENQRKNKVHNVTVRNLANRCDAQLKHRFIDLEKKIGRSPTLREFQAEYGAGVVAFINAVYGTFNNAKEQFGLECFAKGQNPNRRHQVLEGLRAWYDMHGEFPTITDSLCRDRAPLIVSRNAILKDLNTTSWDEAMRRAASMLLIYGGKYGIPEHLRPKDQAA